MIHTHELRLGNYITMPYQDNKPMEVLIIFEEEIETDCAYLDDSEFEPIPLTVDWLIKFGAKKVDHIHGYSFYTFSKSKTNPIHVDIYETKTIYMGYLINHCKYVHQLQNIYFALTGKELIISQK